MGAMKRKLGWCPQDRGGWVSAIPLSLVVVVGALLSIRSHILLRHDRELVVHGSTFRSARPRYSIRRRPRSAAPFAYFLR